MVTPKNTLKKKSHDYSDVLLTGATVRSGKSLLRAPRHWLLLVWGVWIMSFYDLQPPKLNTIFKDPSIQQFNSTSGKSTHQTWK